MQCSVGPKRSSGRDAGSGAHDADDDLDGPVDDQGPRDGAEDKSR
jgi:hypothetical protein